MSTKRSIMLRNRRDWLGRKLCACGCPRLVLGRRLNWATDDCYDRANPTAMRYKVFRRDHGICACCGVDTVKLKQRAWSSRKGGYRPSEYDSRFREGGHWNGAFLREKFEHARAIYNRWEPKIRAAGENRRARLFKLGWPTGSRDWWDADHIVPVVEGGGLCGLEGMRTLCVPCHKRETSALAKRLAKKRLAGERARLRSAEKVAQNPMLVLS